MGVERAAAILNPAAGGGAAGRRWPKIEARLKESGIAVVTFASEAPGHATVLASEAASRQFDAILAVGGDGTVHEVVNGLLPATGKQVPLGIIPAGTGMDIARSLGLGARPLRIAQRLASPRRTEVDVGLAAGGRAFLNFAEIGLGGSVVARQSASRRRLPGRLSFLAAAVHSMMTEPLARVRVEVDGVLAYDGPTVSTVVANGRFFAGGMKIAPTASMGDGHFDVIILADFTRAQLAANIWRVYPGVHLTHPKVVFTRAVEVRVFTEDALRLDLDGELYPAEQYHFRLLPRALTLLV